VQGTGDGELIVMTCQICGQPVKEDEMIVLDGKTVCATCKPVAVQRLMEGVTVLVPTQLPQRELGFAELLTASWRAFRQDWLTICALSLLVAIPINLILAAIAPGNESTFREFVRSSIMAGFLEMLIGIIPGLGIPQIVSERMQGRKVSLGGALAHALRRWLSGVATTFIAYVVIGVLLLAFIVPGIIWLNYYAFVWSVVSLRDRSGTRALAYSKAMVKRRWWAVAGRFLMILLPPLAAVIAIETLLNFVPASRFNNIGSAIINDTLYAFVSVATTVLFLNLEAVGPRPQPVR
jgi:hypothetical protein